MVQIAVFVSPDASALARAVAAFGHGSPEVLGPGAVEIAVDGDLPSLHRAAADAALGLPVDFAVTSAENRRKRLLIADMDSTIIGCECLDELADFAGVKAQVSEITERAMRGELLFEGALRERVGMLKGLSIDALQSCYDDRVRLNPGARILVATMAANGARCALVSGGFTFFTSRVAEAAGFHLNRANTLIEANGKLTGTVGDPILGKEAKLAALQEETAGLGITAADALAVGDGANDLAMIEAAGLGVAYRAKPIVAAQAHAKVDHADLTALLYFQGYKASEFVSLTFPRRVQAVVFDMDGLLLDTETVYQAAMIEAGQAFGIDFTAATYQSMVGKTNPECAGMLRDLYGPDFPVEAYFKRTWSDVEILLEAEVRLKTGVMEILDYLDALGVPRAIATSNSREAVERYLGRFDLMKRFHAVVANADVTRHKPHPDPYLEAARRLNVHPTLCLALEDSHPGVRAAHAAGMMTIMVPDILDPNEEMHDKCVHVAESLHVVLELLKAAA